MIAFYTDHFVLPLPPGHRFPMRKYRMLRERVAACLPDVVLREPSPIDHETLARVHSPEYISRLESGHLSKSEQQKIGFPWSTAMVERSRRSAAATVLACREALSGGKISVNLAGGTHHAYPNHGEGFCCFNDAAVAARQMQAEGLAKKVLILDLDVHQGNGTAAVFRYDPSVFTVSLHGKENYPFQKEASDIDHALPNHIADPDYLSCLDDALAEIPKRFSPDLMIYLAGADPLKSDRLGRLDLSIDGLHQRDKRVLDFAHRHSLSVAVAMAGGYADPIEDTVMAHFNTISACRDFYYASQNRNSMYASPKKTAIETAVLKSRFS